MHACVYGDVELSACAGQRVWKRTDSSGMADRAEGRGAGPQPDANVQQWQASG